MRHRTPRARGQPRRGYRRPKPTAHSDVGRLWSRRAAGFLWYFLSLRKKVRSPWGRQPHRSRRSRRVKPLAGAPLRQSWLFPSLTVGFPRGKQSARAALPCAPIAICLHPSGSFPKRNELPSKRPALPSHEGGSSPFSHQNRAALLFGKRPLLIFVCQSFSASRSTFASAAATHSSTAALYASSCLVLSRDS